MHKRIEAFKSVMTRGTVISFSVGIAAFFIYMLINYIIKIWKPVFKPIVKYDSLVAIIGIVMIILVVATIGYLFSPKKLSGRWGQLWGTVPVVNWFIGKRKMPKSVKDMPGALVQFSSGSYYIGALVGEQKFINKNGETHLMYKLFCPAVPMPWSGHPIIFAKAECVIILKLSFAEIYGINTSYGKKTPAILQEIDVKEIIKSERSYMAQQGKIATKEMGQLPSPVPQEETIR